MDTTSSSFKRNNVIILIHQNEVYPIVHETLWAITKTKALTVVKEACQILHGGRNMRDCSMIHTCMCQFCHILSPEDFGAPICWNPKILFSIFWKGMNRKSYDKTRFCVSREGLPNVNGTFSSPWFMYEDKTKKHVFDEKGLQYNGAWAPIYWSPLITELQKKIFTHWKKTK